MIFGYTPLDPVLVLGGSLLAAWVLVTRPKRLMLFLPAALSVYAIIPFITLLTLADTVPLLILGVMLLRGRITAPRRAQPWLVALVMIIAFQAMVAMSAGDIDMSRVGIRTLYYLTLLALFLFSLNACRNADSYHLLLRGAAIIAVIHVAYGLYQIIGVPTGLPVRGILRGTEGADIAMEGAFVRINGLANEPKRLGYVLGVGALAFFELARRAQGIRRRWLRQAGMAVLAISILTFSGSYFLALALMGLALVALYPRFLKPLAVTALLSGLAIPVFPDTSERLWDDLARGLERRATEVEVGIDGQKVYRQEFFAEEYLVRHPETALTGVGVGRSNTVLHAEYGDGAGYHSGYLLPLNSELFQILFDLGAPAILIVYGALSMLIWRAWRRREVFLMLVLLLLGMQSLSIMVMQYLAVFMGAALARMPSRRRAGSEASTLLVNNGIPSHDFGQSPDPAMPGGRQATS